MLTNESPCSLVLHLPLSSNTSSVLCSSSQSSTNTQRPASSSGAALTLGGEPAGRRRSPLIQPEPPGIQIFVSITSFKNMLFPLKREYQS